MSESDTELSQVFRGLRGHLLTVDEAEKVYATVKNSHMNLSTTDAFKEMISIQFIHRELDISAATVRQYRHRIKKYPEDPDKWNVSMQQMHQLLSRAGYILIQKPVWQSPN